MPDTPETDSSCCASNPVTYQGVRLSRPCLAVCKDTGIEPFDDGVQRRHEAEKYVLLGRLGAEDSVESTLDRFVGSFGVPDTNACLALVDFDHLVGCKAFRKSRHQETGWTAEYG